MSWTRNNKDDGHRETVAALTAIGCFVLQVDAGQWAPPHGRLEKVGAPDLLVLSPAGKWCALELKSPGAKPTNAKQRARFDAQAKVREHVLRLGGKAYKVEGPLSALAAVDATALQARHGLDAAERHCTSRTGPTEAIARPLAVYEHMLEEARERLSGAPAAKTPGPEHPCECGHPPADHGIDGKRPCCAHDGAGKCRCTGYRPLSGEALAVHKRQVPAPKKVDFNSAMDGLLAAKRGRK